MPTLILTPRFTEDSQALWRAANGLGWRIERLTTWRVPEDLKSAPEPVLYLEALFGPTLAEDFGLRLLEPPVDWLPSLPSEYRKRNIELKTLGEARVETQPAFVKPPNDKSFPALVYRGEELPQGYDEESPVLVSEIVSWSVEFRCFILNREVRAMSIYLRDGVLQRDSGFEVSDGELSEATAFVETVLRDARVQLPAACVLDVGVINGRGWAVVEQNAAWASGISGCDPTNVLGVLQFAAVRSA